MALAVKMLNPDAHKWMWLCRNLKLRASSYLSVSRTPVPNFTAEDAAVVAKAVGEQMDKVPSTLSTACVPVLSPAVNGGNAPRSVVRINFNWGSLHRPHADSTPLLNSARNTLVTGNAGGGSSTATRGAGAQLGRRATPTARGASGVEKPTSRRRPPTGAAAGAGLPLSGSKTVRGLRSPAVQRKVKQAHEAVVSAMMDEDRKIDVVKPNYLVQYVTPNKLWPDGGVVVFAQFPFLLDQSWKDSGSWLAWCRKVMCAPDGRSHGGTYEVFFTLQEDNTDQPEGGASSGSSDDDNDSLLGDSDNISLDSGDAPVPPLGRSRGGASATGGSTGRMASGGGSAGDSAGAGRSVDVGGSAGDSAGANRSVGGSGNAADSVGSPGSAASQGNPAVAAGGSSSPPETVGRSAVPLAGSARGGGRTARFGRTAGRAVRATGVPGNTGGAGGTGGAGRSGRHTAGVERNAGRRSTADGTSAAGSTSAAADGSGGVSNGDPYGSASPPAAGEAGADGSSSPAARGGSLARDGDSGAAPERHGGSGSISTAAGDNSDIDGGGASGGNTPGAAVSGGSRVEGRDRNEGARVVGGSGSRAVAGGGSGSRARTVGSGGSASGAAARSGALHGAAPTSEGLHGLYLKAMRCSNEALGLAPGERQAMGVLVRSPPSSFSMNCTFFTDMDLDTTDPDQLSCQTDSYITAAYRARPRVVPSVRRVHD